MILDKQTRQASDGEHTVRLTKIQYDILTMLDSGQGTIVPRSALVDYIWQEVPPKSNSLEAHVYQLRKQLKQAGMQVKIRVVHNVGYTLENI